MIPRITATRFNRFMGSGRTYPALCDCEDPSGAPAGEYVVKLRGGIETRESGLLREMMAAKLAEHFGIASPEPALVEIENGLAELTAHAHPAQAVLIRNSVGLNFGTRLLVGCNTWPVDKFIPATMWHAAVDVFAFDAMIQNPDRRYSNPNLFTKGDSVIVFDHETAFSFLLDLLPAPAPWKLEGQAYLAEHAFYRQLKSKSLDLTGFSASLGDLSDALLGNITAEVPAEWYNDNVSKIERHLRTLREHAEEFAEEVRRILI